MTLEGKTLFRTMAALIAVLALFFACQKKGGGKSASGGKKEDTSADTGGDDSSILDPCGGANLVDELATEDENVTLESEDEHDHSHDEGEHHEDETDPTATDPLDDTTSVSCDPGDDGGTGGTPTGNGSWNPGPGIEGCEKEGKAWIAVYNGGPGICGDPLVTDWCCTVDEVKARFPKFASQIQANFDDPAKGGGKKLYHCSHSGDKYTFHLAGPNDSGGAKYYALDITGLAPAETGNGAENCPKLTLADLGLDFATGDDDGGNADEGGEEDGGEIPETIPGMDSLTAEGLKDFLEANEYGNWTKEAAVHASFGPHQFVKVFFNAALKESIEDKNDEHPVGSVVVKELYKDDKTTRVGWSLMAKIKEGKDASTWLFYQFKDDKQDAYGAGVEDCATCHEVNAKLKSKDFVISPLP